MNNLLFAGGQAKTLMMVQLNPDVDSYSETISTLKFAERVSGVELGAARSNKEGSDVRELMEQVIFTVLLKNFQQGHYYCNVFNYCDLNLPS